MLRCEAPSSKRGFNLSIWTKGKISKIGTRFALGVPLSYRKLASGVTIPSQAERLRLYGKTANWFTMFQTASIVPGATQQSDFTAQGGLIIVALMGNSVRVSDRILLPVGSATVQFYDASNQILWSNSPLNFENMLGSAKQPFWLRSPYYLQDNGHIKVAVQNLNNQETLSVEVIAMGYQN
jgi:hypothetical protein